MARYSLFVLKLKVPLNPKQTHKQTLWQLRDATVMCGCVRRFQRVSLYIITLLTACVSFSSLRRPSDLTDTAE